MTHTEIAKSITNGVAELMRRLETAENEVLWGSGDSNRWAIEVGRLNRLLEHSSNYVTDNAFRPQTVQFNNGQSVRILVDEYGPYLAVSTLPPTSLPPSPFTPSEQTALDHLAETNFLQRLVSDNFDEEH